MTLSKFAFYLAISTVTASAASLAANAVDPPGAVSPVAAPTEQHGFGATGDLYIPKTGVPKKPWIHSDAPITEIWDIHGEKCTVIYDQPEDSSPEAQALFAETRAGLKAQMTGDLEARAEMLDDNFTIEHDRTGQKAKIICGKQAALEAMKQESENMAKHPPSSIQFYYPMAMVYGDSAVVNYKCLVIGRGDEPRRSYGWVENIFVKRADSWKQTHHRSRWKAVLPEAQQPSQSSSTTPASQIKDAAAKKQ
jgi:hypothetical protein